LGCKAIQVVEPGDIGPALERAQRLAHEHKVPVIVECLTENKNRTSSNIRLRRRRTSRLRMASRPTTSGGRGWAGVS